MQSSTVCTAWPRVVVALSLAVSMFVAVDLSRAEESSRDKAAPADSSPDATKVKPAPAPPKLPEPKGAQRLSPTYPVWLDKKEGTIIVEGQISLREGMLEMFACTRNTKEHESIISANTKAQIVHTGLLALGAETGNPVQFQPQYRPPAGTEIEVLIRWLDEKGKPQQARAQDWIKDMKTGKPMTYPFVFAGSMFWIDPDTEKQYYQAERGDFVCVANFSSAMLDIPVKSSKSNEELAFEVFTEKVPPLGAPVQLVFKPKVRKQGAGGRGQGVGEKVQQPAANDQPQKKAKSEPVKPSGKAK